MMRTAVSPPDAGSENLLDAEIFARGWPLLPDVVAAEPTWTRDRCGHATEVLYFYPHDGFARQTWAWYAEQVAAYQVAASMGCRPPFRRAGPGWEEEWAP